MKVHALGAKRMSGKSSKTGKDYDFAQLSVLMPIEPVANGSLQIVGYGYQATDLEIEKTAISAFARFPYPCDLVLVTENRVDRQGMKTVVTGAKTLDEFNKAATLKAAA